MKFIIEDATKYHMYGDTILEYIRKEYSFNYTYKEFFQDFSLTVNYLELSLNEKFYLSNVSGYSPYLGWTKFNFLPPSFSRNRIRVLIDFDPIPGCGYSINDNRWPEYVNLQTGWVCIGDPTKSEKAVEFTNGCVAVLEVDQLVALWLKPKSLPDELYAPLTGASVLACAPLLMA